jgi:hypothetical protein
MFHGGTAVADGFWFRKSAPCTEDAEKLGGLAIDFAEHFQFLENQRPGKNREGDQDQQNDARNQAGLLEKLANLTVNGALNEKNRGNWNCSPSRILGSPELP